MEDGINLIICRVLADFDAPFFPGPCFLLHESGQEACQNVGTGILSVRADKMPAPSNSQMVFQ